jgi:hypothetical protein
LATSYATVRVRPAGFADAFEAERLVVLVRVVRGMVVLDGRLGQVSGKLDRALDVASLGGLVAARQEDDQFSAPLREVHAIAGADIDLEFRHALPEDAMRAGMAVDEPIHANLDPGAGDMVP